MRLVYVDEAGISNVEQEPILVVAGVIVDADRQLEQIEGALAEIVREHVPVEDQDGFILHATELFNGGKYIKRNDPKWPMDLRMRIADCLARLPGQMKLPVAFGWLDRKPFHENTEVPDGEHPKRYLASTAHAVAFMRCAVNIDGWMREKAPDEITMMIVEDNEQSRATIREFQNGCQNISGLSKEQSKFLPLRKIKEAPLFQTKRPSSVLQLADFCAYIFKRYIMDQNDERYLRFWTPMKKQALYYPFEDL